MTEDETPGLRVTRRGALMGGALGLAAAVGVSEADPQVAMGAIPTSTQALPSTTAPEQLRLAWGADPTSEVTVSWSSPGQTEMPAPTLAYSTAPITGANPGTSVALPSPVPLSLTSPRTEPTATSFLDGLSQQTTYHYHVPLTGLSPDTRYYYQVSDGASTPSTAGGQFVTAPTGRAAYRFTAFGDIGTPSSNNPSGATWTESSDTSIYTMDGIISPGDGDGPGLFHLMLADLAYANLNPANSPSVWRDYQANASRAAASQPWMPIQGNHEMEFGGCDLHGNPVAAASRSAADWYNGPYGTGNYLARHLLPDNGLTNWDGNRLQGSFYSFQVGPVLFVCLNTNDIVFQNPQFYTSTSRNYAGIYNGGTLPQNTVLNQYETFGGLTAGGTGIQLVPDTASGTPNLQTQWLEQTLSAARSDGSGVDMIVVCEHHCALTTGPGNGVDLGIRATWLPLYDQYEVDLVISGHDHDYERSYPVRGTTAPAGTATAAFTNPWGSYSTGGVVDTRTPQVVSTQPTVLSSGLEAWDTAAGTVFLQLGGAGAAAGSQPKPGKTTARAAEIWATSGGVSLNQCATEDAAWSANYDTSDNYGYAVFDVIPGAAPGDTQVRYQWFQVPPVATGATVTMPTTPYEEFVFTRFMPAGTVTITGTTDGSASAGSVLSVSASGWPASASFAYQWQRGGSAISGATGSSYTTSSGDVGSAITVAVTVTAPSYPSGSAVSSAVQVVAVSPSTVTLGLGAVAILGTPRVGEELRVEVSSESTGATLSYQWLRGGKPIADAVGASYRAVTSDAGKFLRVLVTATLSGSSDSTTSAAVKVSGAPFLRTALPKITGAAVVGHTVTAEVAQWSPRATLHYEWLLNGHPIPGATHRALRLLSTFAGKRLSVRVTGSAVGYVSHSLSSAHVVVARGVLRAARPRLSGRALVGETLHVHNGEWPAGTEFTYRWYANGRILADASGHALRLDSQLRGARIYVEVTGRLAGHEPASAISGQTRAVRRPWTLL